jgi:hypothetical protein
MADVVVEQSDRDLLQCIGRRRDLGQDVDAVIVVLDHALEAADLALDPAEPRQQVVLVSVVTPHALLLSST